MDFCVLLKKFGAGPTSLVEIYLKQIRCILEFGAPAWQGSLTVNEKTGIEFRGVLHIILGKKYGSYKTALESLNLDNLEVKRVRLCLKLVSKQNPIQSSDIGFKKQLKNITLGAKSSTKKFMQTMPDMQTVPLHTLKDC